MGIFSRIFKVGQAHANQAIDSMEKPEVMLEQAIRDKEKQIREAKQAVQSVIATERQAKFEFNREKKSKEEWESKAEYALKNGKEELAVKALNRASEHEQKAQTMEANWKAQRGSVEKLKTDILKMEDELSEFKRNKDFIIAQSKTADVKKKIYEAKARMSKDRSADDLMARMKAKAERANFEASAAEEMADTFSGGDSLDKEFEGMQSTAANSDVQAKLEAMRSKMKSSS